MISRQWLNLFILCSFIPCVSSWHLQSRRSFITTTTIVACPLPTFADISGTATDTSAAKRKLGFETLGYGQEEYTNSITASRDTNISPREAYDIIRERIPKAKSASGQQQELRVLDVGAGAGVSTQVLYEELGYTGIDAVDWSADAWDANVVTCPSSVHFFALSDDAFFKHLQQNEATNASYDVICYNFAINFRKAEQVAKQYLTETGILLAPINDKADYWYKQSYYILDKRGKTVWKSSPEVGAWSVQFQPDVTADTCTGIWCGGFNGFR